MLKSITKLILLIFLFLILSPLTSHALSANCTVTRVLDGDTFHCIPDTTIAGVKFHKDGTISVRLRGVDAPEKRQPSGMDAQESLKELISRKTVKLDIKDIDRYGRVAAYVFVGSLNVNLEQVKRGLAWAYTEYLDRPYASEFYDAENQARKQRLGLWQKTNPTPPWEWRKKNR
jgi:micrococcal nuclease